MPILESLKAILPFAFKPNEPAGGIYVLPHQEMRPVIQVPPPEQLLKRYRSWVYACVNKNAISASEVPLRLYVMKQAGKKGRFQSCSVDKSHIDYLRKSQVVGKYIRKASGDIEEIVDHPILDLFNGVNDFWNGFELFESLYQGLELTGNGYWLIVRDNMGVPTEIWPLLPQYMKVIVSESVFVSHYMFAVTATKKIKLAPEQVIHFKYPNPKNIFIGQGKLEACADAADLHANMNLYESALFANRGCPDHVLSFPSDKGKPTDDTVARIKAQWNRLFRGVKKSGNMAILHGGAELKAVTLTPKEMAYQKGRGYTIEEIAGIFGVPLSKLTTRDVNRANAAEGEHQYQKDTIQPMLRRIEQKLNERLMPMFDSSLFVAFDDNVPKDKEFRLKERESNLKTGFTTINEERQADNMEPVEYGDIPILPMNMQPLGSGVAVEQEQEQAGPKSNIDTNHSTVIKRQLDSTLLVPVVEASFLAIMRRFFTRQRDEVLGKIKDADFKAVTKVSAPDIVSDWLNFDKWDKELADLVQPFWVTAIMAQGQKALDTLLPDAVFVQTTPRVLGALELRTGRIAGVNRESAKLIRNSVTAGIEASEGAVQIRNRIRLLYDDSFTKFRAARIARTETIWAHNEGRLQGYMQSGVVTAKKWITSRDDRVCEFCQAMADKVFDLQTSFVPEGDTFAGVEGGTLVSTYEDIRHPPLHPLCRCSIVPILVDE